MINYLVRYNDMDHRSEPHSRLENLPSTGLRVMCSWERSCTFAGEPVRRKVGADARVPAGDAQYESATIGTIFRRSTCAMKNRHPQVDQLINRMTIRMPLTQYWAAPAKTTPIRNYRPESLEKLRCRKDVTRDTEHCAQKWVVRVNPTH